RRHARLLLLDHPDNLRLGKTALSHSSAPSRLGRLYIMMRDFAGGRSLGSGNIIKVMLFREMKITKEAFVGAMAATAVLSNIVKLTSYIRTDLLTIDMAWTALALILVAVAVALIGRLFLKKLSAHAFQTGVQVLLGIAAIALLV
ncbi:hypothetical protein AB9K34_21595, partial [Sedimentitalea sp. XS_ASV28]|uniref:hypothetical protein n=1 Tax=Sedimentitalea sp. XS_ASV28 TaxID=3241296 RepID=UPI003512266D